MFEGWMKLAAVSRASGHIPAALEALHRALALDPLDFTALLLRANLLEMSGADEADEAYERALAQKPSHALPPMMASTVAHAERRREAYLDKRASTLDAATAGVKPRLSEAERGRLARFRDNALRRTRVFHSQPTHSHYPGLIEREFHDRADMPWLETLEAAFAAISEEFRAVAAAKDASSTPYIQYATHEPLDQWRALNHNPDWSAIHLLQNGRRIEANARLCPRTMAVLETLPQPMVPGCSPNAMFSLLKPGVTIPPHTGVSNTRLVCHLPLIVPAGCWFRVGAETREWRAGEAFVFDDTIEHEACNPSEELRVVFIIDVWHHGLGAAEREAVAALLQADVSRGAHDL